MKILKASDSVEHILKNPEMYLGGRAKATGEMLLIAVLSDAILLQEEKILYSRIGNWYVLSGLNNWTQKRVLGLQSPLETFYQIIPFPEAGVNSIRSEVLLTAFASHVFVQYYEQFHVVKGNQPEEFVQMQLSKDFPFNVGFCM